MILSPNERLIIISLHDRPKCSFEIAEDLGKRDTVIAVRLRKMQQSNLVKFERTGIRKKYKLTKYGHEIFVLLSAHDASFRDMISEYKSRWNMSESN